MGKSLAILEYTVVKIKNKCLSDPQFVHEFVTLDLLHLAGTHTAS